jgi:hypothetical protein
VGVVLAGESVASWERYKLKDSRSVLKPGDEAFAILLASISRLSTRARIPLAAALVRVSMANFSSD